MTDMNKVLSAAITIATLGHSNQYDLGGNPYILHPLKVMHYVRNFGKDYMILAVLHDVLEDTTVTATELVQVGIPADIMNDLAVLTRMPGADYDEYMEEIIRSGVRPMRVKMADMRHNMDIRRVPNPGTEKSAKRLAKYAKWYARFEMEIAKYDH